MKVFELINILKCEEKRLNAIKLLAQVNPEHDIIYIEPDGKGLGTRGYDTPSWFKWKLINFIKRYFLDGT